MRNAPISSRHRLLVAGLVAATMTVSTGCFARGEAPPADGPHAMPVIAHRGGALLRPENTVPALRHAAELGVEILEFDMVMTADDRIVVYHDGTINPDFCKPDAGSTVVPGPVRGLSFAQVRQFDCGSGVRPAYAGARHIAVPGARIPSLDEVLRPFRDGSARFFAETKIPKDADVDPVKFATLLDAAVREHGLEDRLILQSFDFRTIDALHTINPRIRTCLLGVQRMTKDYLAALRQHHATCIVLGLPDVDAAGVRQLQDAGITVFSNVVDAADGWQKYVDLGVDALFTNDPEGLIAFLRQSGLRR
jgi:glycerophosphoryl diester phosphodiesterase